jgi:hypothetical protein
MDPTLFALNAIMAIDWNRGVQNSKKTMATRQLTYYMKTIITYYTLRASPMILAYASASGNGNWPPSGMQNQMQVNYPIIST